MVGFAICLKMSITGLDTMSSACILASEGDAAMPRRNGVQRAACEHKCAPLHTDFAKEFVHRRYGDAIAGLIYSLLPTFSRGPRKGLVKGYVHWDKVTEGGWRSGAPGERSGVVRPGTQNVKICLKGYDAVPDVMEFRPGKAYEYFTDAQQLEFANWYIRSMFDLEQDPNYRIPGPPVDPALLATLEALSAPATVSP